jgi:transposase
MKAQKHYAILKYFGKTKIASPARCPHCGGGIRKSGVVSQYQTEIPERRGEHIEFRIHVGSCRACGRPVAGRHARQTSTAVGSAASQLEPRALALEQGWGLKVSRGGLCQALARLATKAEPTYRRLIEKIRAALSVTPDETGWKVGGCLWWMWAFSSAEATVYAIQPGRGFEQAAVLGEDFAGFLVRDGWSVYRQFTSAVHQTCLAHLLRRCLQMLEVAHGGVAKFPRTVKTILEGSQELRDRCARRHRAAPQRCTGHDAGAATPE